MPAMPNSPKESVWVRDLKLRGHIEITTTRRLRPYQSYFGVIFVILLPWSPRPAMRPPWLKMNA